MILASLICMALMRFTSLSKHKDAFRMFTGCLSLILIVVFNFFTSGSGRNMTSEQMIQKFAEGNNSMMDMMTGIFITNKFSSYGLLYNNEFKGLLYIIIIFSFKHSNIYCILLYWRKIISKRYNRNFRVL